MTQIAEKLSQLRKLMEKYHLDFYFIPARDTHNNEYVPRCWQRRAWISDFTGSAGDVLVATDQAFLWTDSRYILQAEQQLDGSYYQLMKQIQGTSPISQWLLQHCRGKTCGVDPKTISISQAQQWLELLKTINAQLAPISENLIDTLWQDQPPLPLSPVRQYPLEFAGCSAHDKLATLRKTLHIKNVSAHAINELDAIAWLFNIRGNDVEYNPLIISYALVSADNAILFVNPAQLNSHDYQYLQTQGISVRPYEEFADALRQLQGTVWMDPNSASWWMSQQLSPATTLLLEPSPITLMKAIKNPIELKGMHEAHRLDGLAMVNFFHWLENNWQTGINEISAAQQLTKLRHSNPQCLDLSFSTISGFGPNGAIVHYQPSAITNRHIDDSALYLIDSGGQYLEGTTDITRTIHLGIPQPEEKLHYTLVLKGHLALRHVIFPRGNCGEHLDVLARQPLWQNGLNYGHGTGHGVGCYLCVHEGPQRISPGHSKIPLQPGMVLSNEPGVYFTDCYGIRIENLCAVKEYQDSFYCFEDLTKVPYARNLIDKSLLTSKEIAWINEYHRQVYDLLIDDLPYDIHAWLANATAPL